jgi:CheY-like chemotaxis protein
MKKILLIDDDKLVLKSIKKILEQIPYEVLCASDGHTAQDLMFKNQFDLVICDIRMPEQDGIDVIKRLKSYAQSKSVPEIPFIFITGYASEDAPIDAVKLGAKDYLLKPFDLDELLNSVQKNIG